MKIEEENDIIPPLKFNSDCPPPLPPASYTHVGVGRVEGERCGQGGGCGLELSVELFEGEFRVRVL